MKINIMEIEESASRDSIIQNEVHKKSSITKILSAKMADNDVGIISMALYEPPNPLYIYFIYVIEKFRNRGIGTTLLKSAEGIAIENGNDSIWLQPHEIDDDIPFNRLIDWYKKNGYLQSMENPTRFEKRLSTLNY
jgi:ribosomal protein S18 acetylase RimI-like enzyme